MLLLLNKLPPSPSNTGLPELLLTPTFAVLCLALLCHMTYLQVRSIIMWQTCQHVHPIFINSGIIMCGLWKHTSFSNSKSLCVPDCLKAVLVAPLKEVYLCLILQASLFSLASMLLFTDENIPVLERLKFNNSAYVDNRKPNASCSEIFASQS